MNSKNKFDTNPYRCAITKNCNTRVHKTLSSAKRVFAELKKISVNKNGVKKLTTPPCFEGMQQTINAVPQLSFEEFSVGSGVKFIMTYRFNQDVIENLFGIYRMKGGCNRNPTVKNLRAMFRSQLLNSLIKLPNKSCEDDEDTFLTESEKKCESQSHPPPPENVSEARELTTMMVEEVSTQNIQIEEGESSTCRSGDDPATTLEKCSVIYFAGWVGKKCTEKFNCDECKKTFLKDTVD